jgi:hypothetical protein
VFVNAGRLLAALVLAGAGVVLGQLPAHACTCATASTQAQTKGASDVFTGTITAVRREPTGGAKGGEKRGATMTYDVEVDRVYKGDIAASAVEVTSDASRSRCGLGRLPADRRYVFFAESEGTTLSASRCGGTAPAGDRLVHQVERLLGDGRGPVPPEPEHAEFTMVGDADPPTLTRAAAPGLALVLAGLLGLVVVRRVGARD